MKYVEKITNLIKEYKSDKECLKMIEDSVMAFGSYVNAVYQMETSIRILRFRLEGAEYRYAVKNLDTNRRISHEGAIVAANILNRMCETVGCELICDCDTNDRYAVADFCGSIVEEIFSSRHITTEEANKKMDIIFDRKLQ